MKKIIMIILLSVSVCLPAFAGEKAKMEKKALTALKELYSSTPGSEALVRNAKAVLVFPEITKGGFIVGGQYGKGVLFQDGLVSGYYQTTSASYGLQAGIQKFGYALIFMHESDLEYLKNSDGWDLGVGPSLTIVDKGMAGQLSAATGRKGVYAFFFEQRGLMGGIGLQGTKISRISPED